MRCGTASLGSGTRRQIDENYTCLNLWRGNSVLFRYTTVTLTIYQLLSSTFEYFTFVKTRREVKNILVSKFDVVVKSKY